jgi:phage major head subunit gpT-like protein
MISVNPALLALLNQSIKARFARGLQRADTTWQRIAMEVESTSAVEIYPILSTLGPLREWIGNRVADELSLYSMVMTNKHFEKTLRVNRNKIEDDQFGIYGNEAEMLGDQAMRHPDQLVYQLLEGGFTSLAYDGQYFFDTDHPNIGSADGVGSNKGTAALTVSSYATARLTMQALKDDGGEILDINPDLLVVPPALEEVARNILFADPVFVAGVPQNNIWKGSAQLLISRRLTDTNNWYLFDTSKPIKALIMQFRKRPQIVAQVSLTDDSVFWRNQFAWGVDYRGNAGYGLWQLAYGSQVAGG